MGLAVGRIRLLKTLIVQMFAGPKWLKNSQWEGQQPSQRQSGLCLALEGSSFTTSTFWEA